jgi:hypothetical protein
MSAASLYRRHRVAIQGVAVLLLALLGFAALHALLDDAPRRRALGAAARRYILSHFTWRQVAERYSEALTAAVPMTARPASSQVLAVDGAGS